MIRRTLTLLLLAGAFDVYHSSKAEGWEDLVLYEHMMGDEKSAPDERLDIEKKFYEGRNGLKYPMFFLRAKPEYMLGARSEMRGGLVDPEWAKYLQAMHVGGGKNPLDEVLKTQGIDADRFTQLVYPAAGSQDNGLLTLMIEKVFRKTAQVHMISSSYIFDSDLGRNVGADLAQKNGNKVDVRIYATEYEKSQVEFSSEEPRVWIDKFPGQNGEMRKDSEIYKTAVRLGHIRPGDMILTLPSGVRPFEWEKTVITGASIPGETGRRMYTNWTVSIVTQGDIERIQALSRSEMRVVKIEDLKPRNLHGMFSDERVAHSFPTGRDMARILALARKGADENGHADRKPVIVDVGAGRAVLTGTLLARSGEAKVISFEPFIGSVAFEKGVVSYYLLREHKDAAQLAELTRLLQAEQTIEGAGVAPLVSVLPELGSELLSGDNDRIALALNRLIEDPALRNRFFKPTRP